MSCKTNGFDNTRFFAPKTQGGRESGWDGWIKITVKGKREFLPAIDPQRSALIIVDLQKESCHDWPAAIEKYDKVLAQTYSQRMNQVVVPNVVRLLDLFRREDLLVVYLSLDKGGIIPEIAPSPARVDQGNWWQRNGKEFIVAKYSSGAFATSALDNVLKEFGITTLFFAGTDTAGCVTATMHGAYDRAYQTIMVEDACCSSRSELHEAVVKIWAYKGFIRSTDQITNDYPWQCWIDPNVK